MCFGGKPSMPKPVASPQLQIPATQPIQSQLPQTQSGADQANASQPTASAKKKSLFQIDLTIPTGANAQQNGSAANSTTQTGASAR